MDRARGLGHHARMPCRSLPLVGAASLLAVIIAPAAACGGGGGDDASRAADAGTGADAAIDCDQCDLLDRLRLIPGMTVTEVPIDPPYRFFQMVYQQPVDHDHPDGATFGQRMTLLHRGFAAPVVLHTSGYYEYDQPFAAELTGLLDGNQIEVEQRFFSPSRPDPADWSLLTIAQAAADHHRIVQALKPIYGGVWLATGASKGGMTSIYHRRFYPDDVAATVAYVAPISFAAPDPRYDPFFDTVGDAACRQALESYQHRLLERRTEMLTRMTTWARQNGYTYQRESGEAGAFEDAVIDFEWGFWQYGSYSACSSVPGAGATDDELWDYLVQSGSLDYYDDAGIEYFLPYYYQADTQLGYPDEPTGHIDDVLETQDQMRDELPDGVTATYDDGAAMNDVDQWVKSDGARLMFIYGGFDPWYAGHFDLGGATDSFLYVVPQGNHGSQITDLQPADEAEAYATLQRWTGVSTSLRAARARRPALPPPPPPPRLPPRLLMRVRHAAAHR